MAGDSVAPFVGKVSDVIARAREAWKPPPKLTLSEWADQHFYLSAESSAQPGRWTTLPYQREIMDSITDPKVTEVSLMKSARVGYALALDTPIATPAGWSTMGALRPGDEVFDDRGKRCRVRFKSEVFTDHECYRLTFCDGSTIVADASHRWLVESDVSLEQLVSGRLGRTGRPKIGEVRTFSGVVDTATIARSTERRRKPIAVRNAAGLDLPRADLPVPPYTLGIWLGDGHMVSPRITQHRSDVETAQYVEREGIRVTVAYTDTRYPNNATLFLDRGEKRSPSPWAARFRALGVLSNKHVPAVYLRSSAAQRLELLRGLMDSDGTIGADGRAEFVNTNERLARAVYEIVVSLGMKASFHGRPPQRVQCLPQFRVNFRPTPALNPFHLSRKAAKVRAAAKPSITFRRRVVSVERVASAPVQCIEVDSPSSLYLAGRQLVPTHNTKMLDAALGYFIDQDPSSSLVVQPTLEDAKGFSKEEIGTMLRDCERLRNRVHDVEEDTSSRERGTANTMLHKRYAGGVLSIVGAQTGAGFRRISRRFIACDEIDAYPASAGSDGDPVKLAQKRAEFFWNRKFLNGSTPLIEGFSRIEKKFLEGDQRRFFVPCPQCGHMDHLVFQKKGDDHGATDGHYMLWPKGEPEAAHFVCSRNGCVIEHAQKFEMVRRGEWRVTRPEKDGPPKAGTRSYHVWAAYSFSPNASWGQLAREWSDAVASRDLEQLKTVVNTMLGQTWKESGEAPEWERLFGRRETYPIGTVPVGVRFLTCGVDVQKDRFVYEVVGWALNRESWSIDAGVLMVKDTSQESAFLQLDDLLSRVYPREGASDDAPGMQVRRMCIDTGYNTQNVYNWVRQKDQSVVSAVKGSAEGGDGLICSPKAVDVHLNGKRFTRGVKLWMVGGGVAKGELYAWLRIEPPIPEEGKPLEPYPAGYCHFPQHSGEFFKQLTSERLATITHQRSRQETREWQVIPGRENHWLDCRVYARAAAAMLGLDRAAPPRKPRAAPVTQVAAPAKPASQAQPSRLTIKRNLTGFLNRGKPFWNR